MEKLTAIFFLINIFSLLVKLSIKYVKDLKRKQE